MSVRSSSTGLRSESLFERIRAERKRLITGGGGRRLAHVAELLGTGDDSPGGPGPTLRPVNIRGPKPR